MPIVHGGYLIKMKKNGLGLNKHPKHNKASKRRLCL